MRDSLSHGVWSCEPPAVSKLRQRPSHPSGQRGNVILPSRGQCLPCEAFRCCSNAQSNGTTNTADGLSWFACLHTRSEEENHSFVAVTGCGYEVTSPRSLWSQPGEQQSCKQWVVSVGCPLFMFSCVSRVKAQVGSSTLFCTSAQCKRSTHAASTSSAGARHLLAISLKDMFTNKDLSLYFLQKDGISSTYEPQGPN